jgi:hypothetical protein
MGTSNIDLLKVLLEILSTKLRKISPQLYRFNGTYPAPCGSSVLLMVKGKKFLVTAAHVLEGTCPGEIKLGFGDKFITPFCDWYFLDNKKLDLAVMEINGELEKSLSAIYDFYDLGSINPDHEISMDQIFFTFGYPATLTKFTSKLKKLEVGALAYSTELQKIETCLDLGFHPNTHLVLVLKKKISSSITHNRISPPYQHGMSGSGIWHIPSILPNPNISNIPFILSGIYIEFNKAKSSIVATRTLILTEVLRQKFDCDINQSKKIQFHIED